MLRRVLIASAAAAMLVVTFTPDDAFARGGMRAGGYRGGAVAVRGYRGGASRFEDTGAALSLCAAGATAMGATGPIAATGTVPVRRQWARLRSVPLRRGPTTAAAVAMTPTATGFAHRIERRDAVGLCKEPKASCDGAGDGAAVHVDERGV
jgi:hypothetical protein